MAAWIKEWMKWLRLNMQGHFQYRVRFLVREGQVQRQYLILKTTTAHVEVNRTSCCLWLLKTTLSSPNIAALLQTTMYLGLGLPFKNHCLPKLHQHCNLTGSDTHTLQPPCLVKWARWTATRDGSPMGVPEETYSKSISPARLHIGGCFWVEYTTSHLCQSSFTHTEVIKMVCTHKTCSKKLKMFLTLSALVMKVSQTGLSPFLGQNFMAALLSI